MPRQCEAADPETHVKRYSRILWEGRSPSDTVIRDGDLLRSSRRDRPANAAHDPALGQAQENPMQSCSDSRAPKEKGEAGPRGDQPARAASQWPTCMAASTRHFDGHGQPTPPQSLRSATFSMPAEESTAQRGLADDRPCMAATSRAHQACVHRTATRTELINGPAWQHRSGTKTSGTRQPPQRARCQAISGASRRSRQCNMHTP